MRYQRALVTGGAGFIGSHLVDALLSRGLEVVVLDNLRTGVWSNVSAKAEFFEGDIRDREAVARALAGADIVFHEAAVVSIRTSVDRFVDDADTNLMGTLCLLEACCKAEVRKIVFASSMAVYADAPKKMPLSESYETRPIAPYGVAKLAAERYGELICPPNGIDWIALRYFNTYGPRQGFTPYVGVITIFIHQFLRGERPIIFGTGEQCRDFVYVGDIVQGNLKAMDADCRCGVFNIGSGQARSVNEIAAFLRARIAPELAPGHGPARPGELMSSVADLKAAWTFLGYKPQEDFWARLEETIEANRIAIEGSR